MSAELVEAVRAAYGLDLRGARTLSGGPGVNLNLLTPERYVVRAYQPSVSASRLGAIQQVRMAVAEGGVPVPTIRPTLDGQPMLQVGDRIVEVEEYVPHDGRMNTVSRLLRGMEVFGRVHSILRGLSVDQAGRTCSYANHIEASDALAGTRRGTSRMRGWGLTSLADRAELLASLVSSRESAFAGASPRQLAHGDYWDDNVYFRGEDLVVVSDFDFLAERPRVDDLALTLYFADSHLGLTKYAERVEVLRRFVAAYDRALEVPLGTEELLALPWAIVRQPLWGFGHWVVDLDEEDARDHATGTEHDLDRVLLLAQEPNWAREFAD